MGTSNEQRREHVDRQRRSLPSEPGVYLYHDEHGRVLYVGKAKDLRKRVGSYFTRSLDARLHALVMQIADIEVFVVSSEQEALDFEDRLIKQHRPPFNIMLRDDKSYPYIVVTLADEFPRVLFTRDRRAHRGARVFGPYSSAKRVRETLDLLNRILSYRPCEGREPGRQSGSPCLDFHIERCLAPCVGKVSRDDYRGVIDDVMDVLDGRARGVRERLEAEMRTASADLEFERAARVRNRLRDLGRVVELEATERPGDGAFDVIGVAVGDELANVQLLQVRDGRLFDRRSHFLVSVEGVEPSAVLAQFALAHYAEGRPVPQQIVVQSGAIGSDDAAMLRRELTRVRGARVEIREAQRGEKARLAGLAMRNAEHALTYDSLRERTRIERRQLALEELRDALDLESLPLRIECFDISNTQDDAPVASMTVLEDGRPRKDHYRKFAMRHDGGQNDFAMMGEVIGRRCARLANGPGRSDPAWDESFAAVPNLVIIDGGPGQLNAALEAVRESGAPPITLCSLAKRDELVFLPGRPDPVVLPDDSAALHLVQRIRDEAHRFGLGYHRQRRGRQQLREERGSVLDTLEGVGEARRRALITFFGSPERVIAASVDELEAVPGLPGKVARRIHAQLHRFSGPGTTQDASGRRA